MKSHYPEADGNAPEQPNKISEAQAEYGVSRNLASKNSNLMTQAGVIPPPPLLKPKKIPATSPRFIAGLEAPEEVWAFANQNDLFLHLETAIRLVHECFPSVKTIKLNYEIDWESENESWIAINIEAPGEVAKILQQYLLFNQRIIQQIPPSKSNMVLLGIGGLGNESKN
jgi:hypothetical protein